MQKIFIASVLLATMYISTIAQTPRPTRGIGYIAAGRAISTNSNDVDTLFVFAVGAEKVFSNGLGLGGEVSAIVPTTGGISLGASYHFLQATSSGKFVPFITGGVSNGGSWPFQYVIGAGAHYWIGEKRGIRFEIRDQIDPDIQTDHYLGFRIGYARRW